MQTDAACSHRFQTEQRMIDATQSPRSDKNQRTVHPGNIIDGQQTARQRHHQTARPFKQNGVIPFQKLAGSLFYPAKVYRTAVNLGSQMRRARIGKDFRHGQMLPVFFQQPCSHQPAVQLDVFRQTGIPRLNQFLSYRADSFPVPFAGQISGRITFAYPGIDSAYKINSLFHDAIFLAMI